MNVDALVDQLPKFDVKEISFDEIPYDSENLTLLGEGGRGKVYAIEGEPNKVFKYQTPIEYPPKGKCTQDGYDITHPFTVYESTYPENRHIMTLPAIVSEGLIGGMLNKLLDYKYTINFLRTYELGYLPDPATSFLTLEKVQTDIDQMVRNDNDFLLLLFQFLHGIMVAQEMISFTHYDSHPGNLLYIPTNLEYIKYPLVNKSVTIRTRGFILKIADYGSAVGKYRSTFVNPFPYNCIQRTYAVFNPQYDILAFWGSLLVDSPSPFLQNNMLVKKARNLDRDLLIRLFRIFFNPPGDLTEFDQIKDWITSTYFSVNIQARPRWRPRDLDWVKYFKIKSVHYLLDDLATLLQERGLATEEEVGGSTIKLNRLPRYVLDQIAPEISYFTAQQPSVDSEVLPGIRLRSFSVKSLGEVKYYNLVPSKKETQQCRNNPGSNMVEKTQYISEVIINLDTAMANGYRFNLECCRVSLLDYMTLNKLEGVAINGGFFDINKSYLPTALFKNRHLSKNSVQIPNIYLRFFGMYNIDEKGLIHLGRIEPERLKSAQFEACGPLLVYDGKVMITEEVINIIYKNKLPFQCSIPTVPGNKNKFLTLNEASANFCNRPAPLPPDIQIPNCDAITGGELSHASNPNPRSMILTRINSQGAHQIVFVVVEGRNERGDGMDLIELARFAVERYKADRAVSLDGGSSSNIVLKMPGNPTYYVVNEKKETKYPVGSIISFTKKS